MTTGSESKELLTQIREYRQAHHNGRFPDELRERAEVLVRQRREKGRSWHAIARELGISQTTAVQWGTAAKACESTHRASTERPIPQLVPVVVSDRRPVQTTMDRIEVEFPNGVRLRALGLGSNGLEQLMRVLEKIR